MRVSRTAIAGAAFVAALASCSSDPPIPVSRIATAPWVCPGVPRAGVELALGGAADPDDQTHAGDWGKGNFDCNVLTDDLGLNVQQHAVAGSPWGDGTAAVVENLRTQSERNPSDGGPIEAEAPGIGYVTQVDGPVVNWVCNDLAIQLRINGDPPAGRDSTRDATNLLVSMLPWACGEEPPPLDDADA